MIKRPSRPLAIVLGISGILLFSTKAVWVKLAYQYGIEPVPLLALRMGFSLPIYLVLALTQRRPAAGTLLPIHYMGLVLAGILGYYLASLFDFLGLQYIKAGLERLILFTYPIMVLLINRLVYREALTRRQYLAMAITYVGMVIIFAPEIEGLGDQVLVGGGFILISALSYATYLVGSGRLLPRFGVGPFTSYCMLVSCTAVLMHYVLTQELAELTTYPAPVYGFGIAMAIVATVIPTYLISAAIRRLGASTFALFAGLGPISTIALAYIWLGERLSPLQWLGSVVVIGGIWLVSRKKRPLSPTAKVPPE